MLESGVLAPIRKKLADLKDPVKLLFFSSNSDCKHCKEIEGVISDIANLNPKLSSEFYNLTRDSEKAKKYQIDKTPAIILENKSGKQARFFGFPVGEEFSVFLSDLIDLSSNKLNLPDDIVKTVRNIKNPTHLQVFVTSTCPYCPSVVKLTHAMAMANPHIKADMVRVEEFRSLADRYGVTGVPKTVVNNSFSIDGLIPSDVFLKRISDGSKK